MVAATIAGLLTGAAIGALFPSAIGFTIAGSAILGGAVLYGGIATIQYGVTKLFAKKPVQQQLRFGDPARSRTLQVASDSDAVWVLGRVRIAGFLVWHYEASLPPIIDINKPEARRASHDMDLCIVLSEGPCEGLNAVYIDGSAISLQRGSNAYTDSIYYEAGGEYNGKLKMWFYANGGDSPPQSLRAISTYWDGNHTGKDLCFVHVKLTQPGYQLQDSDRKFWDKWPQIEFVLDGIKITWPGQTTPTFTRNAAALRYWFETERRGRPVSAFDEQSVRDAITYCDETVQSDLRYAIDGIVTAGDGPDVVATEMDFAWQGEVAEINGTLYFYAGRNIPNSEGVSINIKNEGIESVGVKPAPALNQRINQVTVTLNQSRDHNWLTHDIDAIKDTDAIERDGEVRPSDIGNKVFISNPNTARRLMAIALRRARASAVYTYRLRPGDDFENCQIYPNSLVLLTDEEYGLEASRMLVIQTSLAEDWSVVLSMIEFPDNIYDDTTFLPPLQARQLTEARPINPDTPSGLSVRNEVSITQDGNIKTLIIAEWDIRPFQTVCQIEGLTDGFRNTQISADNQVIFDVPTEQTYRVTVFHRSTRRIDGDSVDAETTPDWSVLAPPEPVVNTIRAYPGFAHIILESISNRDIIGLEARYNFEDISSTESLDAITTEDQWTAADRLDISTLVPSINGQGMFIAILIPETGYYRISGRYVTRQGLLGDIGDFGTKIFSAPVENQGTFVSQPLFGGTFENMDVYGLPVAGLVYDPGSTTLQRRTWDGRDGWPFGPVPSGTTCSYTTRAVTLENVSEIECQPFISFHRPSQNTRPSVSSLENLCTFVMQSKLTTATATWTDTNLTLGSFTDIGNAITFRMKVTVGTGFDDASINELGFDYKA